MLIVLMLMATLTVVACSNTVPHADPDPGAGGAVVEAPSAPVTSGPPLRVEVVAAGLDHPWNTAFLPDGRILLTQRSGALSVLSSSAPGAVAGQVQADLSDIYVRGESGLMGLALRPDFATSRLFTTCQSHAETGRPVDIRLVTWRLSPDDRSAQRVRDPLVGGLPLNPSGRHSGCRPTFAPDGALLVGTGDAAQPTVAQDRHKLGGKVLRVDAVTGGPPPGNPFLSSPDPAERLIYNYGHRNLQGVAVRPGTGEAFTVEHGTDRDDEVNLVLPGANYGWDPSRGSIASGYDESVPMTDTVRFPNSARPAWSSGYPNQATSGAAFLDGPQWGDLRGALTVATLRGQKLLLMRFGADPTANIVTSVNEPAELNNTHGRLRSARLGPDGALYVTTDNGTNDEVLRITRA